MRRSWSILKRHIARVCIKMTQLMFMETTNNKLLHEVEQIFVLFNNVWDSI